MCGKNPVILSATFSWDTALPFICRSPTKKYPAVKPNGNISCRGTRPGESESVTPPKTDFYPWYNVWGRGREETRRGRGACFGGAASCRSGTMATPQQQAKKRRKKKRGRPRYSAFSPDQEEKFVIHPRRATVRRTGAAARHQQQQQQRRRRPRMNDQGVAEQPQQAGAGGGGGGSDYVELKHTKQRTVNIFTSNARSLAWLEADAELRRKYEKYSNASAQLYAANKLLGKSKSPLRTKRGAAAADADADADADAAAAHDNIAASTGYRPYVPEQWLRQEMAERHALVAGKPTGAMSSHYGHAQAVRRAWVRLQKFYALVMDPVYASKNMQAAASVNDALRAQLHRDGAALAFDNLAPLHWVSKEHFLGLLFAYYKFSPFGAHAAVGAVFDSTLAERPWVERLLFREPLPPRDFPDAGPLATTVTELVMPPIDPGTGSPVQPVISDELRRRARVELMRMGAATAQAVRDNDLDQFAGQPIADTRSSGDPHVVVLPSPTRNGRHGGKGLSPKERRRQQRRQRQQEWQQAQGGAFSLQSMLINGSGNARPIVSDSVRLHDGLVPNISEVAAGARINQLRLQFPSRIDRRVVVARLRILERPMAAKANLEFAMSVFEWDTTQGVRIRDFVQIVALPAMDETECQLSLAVREALLQRERDLLMFQEVQATQQHLGASAEQLAVVALAAQQQEREEVRGGQQHRSPGGTLRSSNNNNSNSDNLLDRVHPYHYYLEFLSENPVICTTFAEHSVARLSPAHRARVWNAETELARDRFERTNESMKRKKAMYYWVHASMQACVDKWRRITVNQQRIRASCKFAEDWYQHKWRKHGVRQWGVWVKKHQQDEKELKWAVEQYAQMVFKQMFRRWKSTTKLEKKLREIEHKRLQAEYAHAMKNLIRLMDRQILRKVKSSTFYSFSRWKLVVQEEMLFERSAKWWMMSLQRKAFNRLRDDAWRKIEARRQDELDKNARQEEMMEAAREGERLAEQARLEWEAEQAAEAARLAAIEAEKQRYIDEMNEQRAQAIRDQRRREVIAYQREERLKELKRQLDAIEAKHNGKWDGVEAGMCDKARFEIEDMFTTPGGKARLEVIAYDMIEEVAANIKSQAEREQAILDNDIETPRAGRPDWRVMYNPREAVRYWHCKSTGEDVQSDFLTSYTSKSRKKAKEMAMSLYADRKVVEARQKSLRLRESAWDKEVRVFNAKRLTTWWRRMQKRSLVIEEQWRADLQRFRVKKAKFHPAATIIQACARGWLAHAWLLYLVQDLQGVQRVVPDDGSDSPAYWYQASTGASTWEPPTALSRRLERIRAFRENLREERKHRMGKKLRAMQAKMSVQKQGLARREAGYASAGGAVPL